MVSQLISRVIMVVFGTLYPAYRSYKAVKNKEVREYVKWMMYWIVYAFFTTAESIADVFISWLPLYYEVKIVFIIWLLSPATKGASILYRRFIHPRLLQHENKIDKYIDKAKENSYATMMDLGKKGLNVATDTFVKTAIHGQGALVNTLRLYGNSNIQQLMGPPQDVVDGAPPAGWQTNPAMMQQSAYDPENDVELLQQQYAGQGSRVYYPSDQEGEQPVRIRQEGEPIRIRKAQSEMNLSYEPRQPVRQQQRTRLTSLPGEGLEEYLDDDERDDPNDPDYRPPQESSSPRQRRRIVKAATTDDADTSVPPETFNYSSSTLPNPRSRKTVKQPLYERQPGAGLSQSRVRVSNRTSRTSVQQELTKKNKPPVT